MSDQFARSLNRLVAVLGAPPQELAWTDVQKMVVDGVAEDTDLDFKGELYGGSDSEKRELAGDLAALANHRGGALFLGVDEEEAVASGLPGVELSDAEEGRMRQIAAGLIVPHLPFEITAIKNPSTPGHGVFALTVPASADRPFAVRVNKALRYPRRDGTTTRYLSESEVADAYRDRLRRVEDQELKADRLIHEAGTQFSIADEQPWLVLALIPVNPGSMGINQKRKREVDEWIREHSEAFGRGTAPGVRIGSRRYRASDTFGFGKSDPGGVYAELHTDGSSVFARAIFQGPNEGGPTIWEGALLREVLPTLQLLAEHAVVNAGAYGDALVDFRLVSTAPVTLLATDPPGSSWYENLGRLDAEGFVGRYTLNLEDIRKGTQSALRAVRLLLSDLTNAFGVAEVRTITEEGALRLNHLPDPQALKLWAEREGVEVTEETLPLG